MKKPYIVLLFGLLSLSVKAQNLLNLDKGQIKKYMATRHAILKRDDSYSAVFGMPPLIDLYYKFPDSLMSKDGIYLMTFFFTKAGKCYKYLTQYTSDKFLPKIVSDLNRPESGLKRIGKDSIWTDLHKGYEVEIERAKFNNKTYQQKYSIFAVDIHLKNK